MSNTITIPVDVTNPGQFFACCGLLELAHRANRHAEGWFENGNFLISNGGALRAINDALAGAPPRQADPMDDMTSPLFLPAPFDLYLDWWKDDRAGGSAFKTWAGQQKVVRIVAAMHAAVSHEDTTPEALLNTPAVLYDPAEPDKTVEPFYFDSRRAAQAKSVDVGFSADAHGMAMPVYAAVEILCLIGLQRTRPAVLPDGRFEYHMWSQPVPPATAAAVASGAVRQPGARGYAFPLLYRTKYLKGFLPATPQGDSAWPTAPRRMTPGFSTTTPRRL